jgi:16S rRNA G1207 methylase RsmC
LLEEEFKKCGTPGIARKNANAQRLENSTLEQKNSIEAAFDSTQLILINPPSDTAN